ncbi:unnamed protein product [Rhizophagus irregularis]|nr:unnamed protein product [Rhizophagus irregularis]
MSIYIMEEGGLKKRKTTKTTPCCPLNKSVFVGRPTKRKKQSRDQGFYFYKIFSRVSHVLKTLDKSYGHIHFETENEAGTFYQRVQGQEFTFPDGKKTSFYLQKWLGVTNLLCIKLRTNHHMEMALVPSSLRLMLVAYSTPPPKEHF